MLNIRKRLSTKLTLGIMLLAAPIFILALGVLYTQSRHIIRVEAVGHANSMLNNTMQRVCRQLWAVENATNANSWLVLHNLQPDSILSLTHRIVSTNPHIDGCSISMEPDFFPQYGRYFSAYSIREDDSVTTVVEEQYEYFVKPWYKLPHDMKKAVWVDFFDETDSLEVALNGMIASYSKPIYNKEGKLVAVISSDVSLKKLSKVISQEKPYPNSYFIMLDREGCYHIHPDSTRLFIHSIFEDVDPRRQSDIIALGHEMTAGNQGSMAVTIDGVPSLVCYQPVPGTSWSLALVSPDSDILNKYNKLTYILVPLLVIGVILIIVLCHRTVTQSISPLNSLLEKAQSIAAGNTEIHIPRSQREDAVGQLQNSFASMLQWLNFHMGSVRYTTEKAQQRNEELAEATRLAMEADKKKTAFLQNVTHQIRTPLNIIMGFSQVLGATSSSSVSLHEGLSDEERRGISSTLKYNSNLLNRLVLMLFDSSDSGLSEELKSHKRDQVPCNDVAREAISYIYLHYPYLHVSLESEVDDTFCIQSNRKYLMLALRELLYNSAKYSDGKHITLRITRTESTIRFVIEDTGKGIAEADREQIFEFFTKVDDLSEGLGLGLPLTKRHAQNLGGDLTLDEDYHDGCRFIVELPITSSLNA